MLKLLLTLAAVIAIAAAVPSDTHGLEFQDLQDSDTDDLLADVSDELDVADELHLDDEAMKQSSQSQGQGQYDSMPSGANGSVKNMRPCCKRGTYGTPGGSCTSCPPNHTSPTTENGIENSNGKCPNEATSSCISCNRCQRFDAATGECVAKCSGSKKNCKTSGSNAGKCY
jgi:hypothetical protein